MLYAISSREDTDKMRVGGPWEGEVPHLVQEGEELGHLINDVHGLTLNYAKGAGPVLRGGIKDLEAMLTEYHKAAEHKSNVAYPEGPTWAMRATRDIQPGEELLYSYGPEYWLARLLYAQPSEIDPFDRLVVYLYSIEYNLDEIMRSGFMFLDEVGRPSLSTTGEAATDERCDLFLRTVGFGDGRGEDMMPAAGIKPGMAACEVMRRMCIYATEPDADIPPPPLSLDMVSAGIREKWDVLP
jgi:hypothetical protein